MAEKQNGGWGNPAKTKKIPTMCFQSVILGPGLGTV